MKKILIILFTLILVGCGRSKPQSSEHQLPEISETSSDKILPIAVRLRVDYDMKYKNEILVEISNDWGSGFFVEKNQNIYLITALHNTKNLKHGMMYIVSESQSIKVADQNTKIFIVDGGSVDYVAIPVKNLPIRPYILKVGKAKTYDKIYAYGYPGGNEELIKTDGNIRYLEIHTNTPIKNGNSGGPYVNSKMEVVGVVTNLIKTPDTNIIIGSLGTAISDFYDELP